MKILMNFPCMVSSTAWNSSSSRRSAGCFHASGPSCIWCIWPRLEVMHPMFPSKEKIRIRNGIVESIRLKWRSPRSNKRLTKELQSGWAKPFQDDICIPKLHPLQKAGPAKSGICMHLCVACSEATGRRMPKSRRKSSMKCRPPKRRQYSVRSFWQGNLVKWTLLFNFLVLKRRCVLIEKSRSF